MILKKKFLLLILFSVIILQTFLYTNNNQKSSFRYFKWTVQDVSVGKLIGISFFSGLLISTLLNISITSYNNKNTVEFEEEDFESPNIEEDIKSNIEMPPQMDIRDTQPTISVNYRVVKNMEETNLKNDQNYSNNQDNKDDWNNVDTDW